MCVGFIVWAEQEVVVSHKGILYGKEYGWQWRAEAEAEADKMISQSVRKSESHPQDNLGNFLRFLWRGDRNETPYQGTAVHTSD